jgi:hypothetical protein
VRSDPEKCESDLDRDLDLAPLGNNQVTTPHGTKQSILPIQITMANRTAQMKGGQSYLDSPKGAGQKKKATQGESKVSTRKPIYLFPQKKK